MIFLNGVISAMLTGEVRSLVLLFLLFNLFDSYFYSFYTIVSHISQTLNTEDILFSSTLINPINVLSLHLFVTCDGLG